MKQNDLNLDRKAILDKKFTPNVKGYDPSEVDEFLDLILNDYLIMEKQKSEMVKYKNELESRIGKLNEQIAKLNLENHQLKPKADAIDRHPELVGTAGGDVILRIRKLEDEVSRLGGNPHLIK